MLTNGLLGSQYYTSYGPAQLASVPAIPTPLACPPSLPQVESLSGGERRRLHLAAVLATAPNILILDEPTNDLDLSTVEVLEEFLGKYRGLLLVVSHDRSFMEGATDDLLVLPGDGSVERFQGTYSDYLRHQQKQQAER